MDRQKNKSKTLGTEWHEYIDTLYINKIIYNILRLELITPVYRLWKLRVEFRCKKMCVIIPNCKIFY